MSDDVEVDEVDEAEVGQDGPAETIDDGGTDGPAPTAQAVLAYLVKAIVDDPDAVEIEVDTDGRRPSFDVHVAQGDMGRVIGKRGRVAQSIRTVVRAAAVRDGVEVEVEFVD